MSDNKNTKVNPILPSTTYTQHLLQQWLPLKSLIWLHGASISQYEQAMPLILHDDIISYAINSPYKDFFLASLRAVSKTEHLRIALLQQKNESISEAQKQGIDTRDQLKIPDDLLEQISITSLETLQKQLLSKIEMQHEAWQNNLERWANDIITILSSNNFDLKQDEIKDFSNEERYCDLEARAKELRIEFKAIKQAKFSDYYRLKTRILIQRYLSGRQLEHTTEAINKAMAFCKDYFMQINHDESELNIIQTDEIKSELGILDRDDY